MSVLFGILVGLALGLTGGGGSIFAVRFLVYGLAVAPKTAVAVSLGAVAVTAAFGAAEGCWHRVVELRAGLIFAVSGMISAPGGMILGSHVSDTFVLFAFATLMLVVAARMALSAIRSPADARVIRARPAAGAAADSATVCHYSADGRLRLNAPCSAALAVVGLIVGVLSGFFGVGGGFLIVPALIFVTEMGIHRAVATSLLVITLIGSSGLVSAIVTGREIAWALTGLFIIGGAGGMFLGRLLAHRLAGPALQLIFAAAVVATSAFMFVERFMLG